MALPMLTRWNPLRQATSFDPFTDLEDIFRGLENRTLARPFEKTLEMRMDVNEDDKAYRITVDIPGVKKQDIDVAVEGNQVTISAEALGNLDPNYVPPAQSLKFAVIVVATLPILMFYPFLQKHFTKGMLIGSVKG